MTDEDVAAVRAAGLSEDQIFEIVVCAAVGQAEPAVRAAHSPPWPALWKEGLANEARYPRPRSSPAHQSDNGADPPLSGHPVVDAVKLAFYRPNFYGGGPLTHEAMRHIRIGQSAIVVLHGLLTCLKANECPFCVSAHSATSTMWYADQAKVAATLTDSETAPIEEPLRATLRMLCKLTHENGIEPDDVRAAPASSVSAQQIKDALAVSLAFNITDRLANAFGFTIPNSGSH